MERLAALVEVGEDPRARAASSYSLSLILRARGELQQAAAWGGRAVQAAERLGHERLLRLTYSQMFMICHCLGEWDEALEWGQKELRYTDPVTPYIARRLALEAELGHADQVERLWERLAAPRQRPWHRSAVALTTAAVSRITGDRSRLHLVTTAAVAASVPEEGGQLTTTRRRIGAARGLLAVMRDDKQAARDILAEQERWQTVIPDAYVNLVTPRLLGLLAGTVGDRQGAITHFERAVLVCSESGARPELAWSMADYAELLLAEPAATRGVGVAPRSAGTLLQEAKALSSSLGMAPLQARLNGLSTRLADATTGPEAIGGRRLTRREREVLQLLRTGQTNKEISFALGISVKTTENHIANIFAKTGVGNRTEAAALGKKG
jgi:DNA-binding CsgD family transcriptional regulator/tetratricopeptide (TPR) repeat protein